MHTDAVLTHELLVVGVDGGGVAGTQLEHLLAHLEGLLLVVGLEHGLHRSELLVGQRLVVGDFLALGGQNGGVGRNLEASSLGDELRGLARHRGVQHGLDAGTGSAAEHVLFQLGLLFGVDEVGLTDLELLDELVVDVLVGDDGLLGGADHAVIEVLGEHQIVGGAHDVHVLVDVGRRVAGAHAQGGLAGGVCGLDHARTAGREDGGDAVVLHQCAGRLDGGVLDPLDAVLGGARLDGGVAHDLGCCDGTVLGAGVEAEDDRAAGLQCDQGLEDGGGGRVGDRGDAGDHADGLGDLIDAHHIVFADDAHGLLAGQIVGDVLAGEDVLGGLVFHETTAGLVDGHLGENEVLVQSGDGCLGDDTINLLLVEVLEFVESLLGAGNQRVNLGLSCGLLLFWGRLGSFDLLLCFCHLGSSSIFLGYMAKFWAIASSPQLHQRDTASVTENDR